jgi:transposase InsO family protein
MRYSASNTYEVIQLVQHSDLSVKRTLARSDIHKSTFYNWLGRYHGGGIVGLEDKKLRPSMAWNEVPPEHSEVLIDFALREADFTYFKLVSWGWYYLSTVLDDYSRVIVAWRLCTTMTASDVSDTLDDALGYTKLNQVKVQYRPR